MISEVANISVLSNPSPAESLENMACGTRVFVSMPYIRGITPRALVEKGTREDAGSSAVPRLAGIFQPDEIGLPAFDHGFLYGDAVFEGVLVANGRLFQWREHLERLYASAERLQLTIPYSPAVLSERILATISDTGPSGEQATYLRLLVTRGIGDLGIHPANCASGTVCCIASRLQLYPELFYQQGLHLALARSIRRTGPETVDPKIKSCNYLNNIFAVLDTFQARVKETIMLSREGCVAEATTDNIFVVLRDPGWEDDPSQVRILTPSTENCLKGITRDLVMGYARGFGFKVEESATILPIDLVGEGREVFLTGTGAGLISVVQIDGHRVGDGSPGPVTKKLGNRLVVDLADPAMGLKVSASREEIEAYLYSTPDARRNSPSMTEDFVRSAFAIIDSRDWDRLAQVFCEDVTYERPGYEPLIGYERVKKFYCEERVIVSGTHFLEGVVMGGGQGACWGRFIGKHKNGLAIDERFADAYTFANGKIKTRKSYFFRPAV